MDWFDFFSRPVFDTQTYQAITLLGALMLVGVMIGWILPKLRQRRQ
ncbi:MAG: hypothetical protein NWF07_07450 [Candidatus Bathyarchaeota archaeon]|nr:hypothetical protein [Candidatus Bathyarchaeota archaeon]